MALVSPIGQITYSQYFSENKKIILSFIHLLKKLNPFARARNIKVLKQLSIYPTGEDKDKYLTITREIKTDSQRTG